MTTTTPTETKNVDLKKLSYAEIENLLLTDKLFISDHVVELYHAHIHDDNIRNLLAPHMDQL